MDNIREKLCTSYENLLSESDTEETLRCRNTKNTPKHSQRSTQMKFIESIDQQHQEDVMDIFESSVDNNNELSNFEMKRKHSAGGYDNNSIENNEDDNNFVESYVVIEFVKNINWNTLHWIIDKIRGKKSKGGAELILRREPQQYNQGLTIHLSATKMRLLEIADELGIMKNTKNGTMKNFNIVSLDDFLINDTMNIDNLLTPADKQIIVKHALESIKAKESERNFPGNESISLYRGESILQACIKADIITNIYSLHDREYLKKLENDWYFKILKQPLDRVREYFGESIGIYFSFVGFYTMALIVPTILGFLQYTVSYETMPFFCVFNVVWMTVFTEIWKRKCSALAYKWGTITMTNLDLPRIGYYGKLGKDPITGKLTPQYPLFKTYVQMYCVSMPIILIFILTGTALAYSQFWLEDELKKSFGADSYLIYLPSIAQSIIVAVLSMQYEYLSTWLTDMENHRTQQQYERHRVNKLIILEFVNNFIALFYIAFILRDIKQLRNQLMTQLIIVQAFQNLQETLWPIFKQKFTIFKELQNSKKVSPQNIDGYEQLNIIELPSDDYRIEQNKAESTLDEYNSTYEDYLELYIQFGYVVLFSSVAPLAAFWAFINNVVEIRLDAFKLCKIYQRPFAKRARDTGAWLLAFQVLSLMSIMTNCGIMYLSPQIKQLGPSLTPAEWIVILVILEHLLLVVTWCIHKAIPDCPHWIRVALARNDYESRQALKRENAQRSRLLLFRRFRSVHGPHNPNYPSYFF